MLLPPLRPLEPGTVFAGRWRIVSPLGKGGMGVVYQVQHERTEAWLALKVMRPELTPNRELRERFRREAVVTSKVRSDHVVAVFDAGTDEQTKAPFIVMELLEGEGLDQLLGARGRLPATVVVRLLRQVAYALDATHRAGLVHRDLKPSNVFVTRRDDGEPRVMVIDFGIAKIVAASFDAATTAVNGTPHYMAPEQIRGDGNIGPAADRHALAHLAYHLLVGETYWQPLADRTGKIYPLLRAISLGAATAASEQAAARSVVLPADFDDWFRQATAVAPEARFGSSETQIHALADALGVPRVLTSERWW